MKTLKFDVADHLDSPQIVAEYLSAALAEGDPVLIAECMRTASRSPVMAPDKAKLIRESLCEAGSSPRLETVLELVAALGLKLILQQVPALPVDENDPPVSEY